MKIKLYKVVFGLAFAALWNACSLDEYNPTSVPAEERLSNFEDWLGYQSMCYQALAPNVLVTGTYSIVAEGGTDLWFAPKNSTNARQLLYYTELTNTQSNCGDVWNRSYMSIQQCSDAIRLAQYVENGTQEDMKVLVAEAYFLRGYFFSVLTTYFGNVTLVNEHVEFTEAPVRNTYEELYEQIISDLKIAVEDLGVTPFRDNPARPTKKAALGILARAYLQGAGYGLSENGVSYWQRAKEVALELIDNASGYGAYLYEDFEDVFAQGNNKNNLESLFKAVGTNPLDQSAYQAGADGHNLLTYFGAQPGKASEFFAMALDANTPYSFYGRMNSSTMAPSRYLIDCFDAQFDKRWENSFITAFTSHSFEQAYANGDASIPNQKPYAELVRTITQEMVEDYEMAPSLVGRKIYPYVDLGSEYGYSGGPRQIPARVWPKGDHSGDPANLLEVKNVYVHPYPLDVDEDRFGVYLSKDYLSEAEKAERGYLCINIDDMFDPATGQYYETFPKGYGGSKDLLSIFPMLSKFCNNFLGSTLASNAQRRAGDIMIMRMAEIYLIAAEATLMTGGSGSEAAQYLNVLRKRACRDAADFNTSTGMELTTADMDDVFDEYARELCGEFNRWALLRRHNALGDRLQRFNKRAYDEYSTDPEKYNFRPIINTFFGQITNAEDYGNNGY